MDVNQPIMSEAKVVSPVIEKPTLQGISGWLILPVIGLFYMFYQLVMMSLTDIHQVQIVWPLATNTDSYFYVPMFEGAFYSLQVGYGVLAALLIWTLIAALLWQRKAKVLFIATMLLYTLIAVTSHFIFPYLFNMEIIYSHISEVIGAVIYCFIWGPYFGFSERVKQTFIR
ncbi:DUF2569 family protein [Providencia sneebia]|uniref:DUF2569 domain-containing protein n=1 Tax=Providencia sneebia DSM 19967 TaxID=1141660 RepID=K8WXK6_9GAMM|nr:DUF2569 family protein [Providencia sneebia]EKT60930.1 hypothetical protein OO7_02536 [Providencia sneebia DSM 19967]